MLTIISSRRTKDSKSTKWKPLPYCPPHPKKTRYVILICFANSSKRNLDWIMIKDILHQHFNLQFTRNKMPNSLPNIQKYASFKNPFWKRRCDVQSSTLLLEYILMCGSVNRVWPIFWFFMPQPNGCNWPLIKFSLTYSTK